MKEHEIPNYYRHHYEFRCDECGEILSFRTQEDDCGEIPSLMAQEDCCSEYCTKIYVKCSCGNWVKAIFPVN